MSLTLDRTARRIIGVLIEKEFTTPNAYPLTVNSLTSGCSQKNNRHPVEVYEEFQIEGALRTLYLEGFATNVSQPGARVLKWKHRAAEKFGVDGAGLAVMAELLLRGSQQPGELRINASRMVTIASIEDLEKIVDTLTTKGLVRTSRRPGERAFRHDHTLYPEGEVDVPEVAAAATTATAEYSPRIPSSPDRIAALEARIDELTRRLERLEHRLPDTAE